MTLEITIPYPRESLSPHQAKAPQPPSISNDDFFGSFADFLDVVNPLQHIPVVSTIYREATGDTLSSGARMAGGTLFGGALGFVFSIANAIIEEYSGKDIGANLFAAATGKYDAANELS